MSNTLNKACHVNRHMNLGHEILCITSESGSRKMQSSSQKGLAHLSTVQLVIFNKKRMLILVATTRQEACTCMAM